MTKATPEQLQEVADLAHELEQCLCSHTIGMGVSALLLLLNKALQNVPADQREALIARAQTLLALPLGEVPQ